MSNSSSNGDSTNSTISCSSNICTCINSIISTRTRLRVVRLLLLLVVAVVVVVVIVAEVLVVVPRIIIVVVLVLVIQSSHQGFFSW